MDKIRYQKLPRWKYRLVDMYQLNVGFYETKAERGNEFVWLDHGLLTVFDGYAWDGPSGPAIDTKSWMRASLVHDALYQLIREGHVSRDLRRTVDQLMRSHLLEDGMSRMRAYWSYAAIRSFGKSSTYPSRGEKIMSAP